MTIELTMPRLSDTMESGTIIKWNVTEGQAVSSGDVIADVETDKATMEMQVYDDGTVARLLVPEGQTVPIGTPIAVIAERGEDASKAAATAAPEKSRAPRSAPAPAGDRGNASPAAAASVPPRAAVAAPAPALPAEGDAGEVISTGDGRLRVSPVARRMADDHGINLGTIHGSGPAGRVIKRDVLKAIEASHETAAAVPPAASPRAPGAPRPGAALATAPLAVSAAAGAPGLQDQIVPLSGMRQTIARRLVESATTIPHYQVSMSFAMDALLSLRQTLNTQLEPHGVKLSVNDFLVRGCALAIHQHPEFNSSWARDSIEIHGHVNIGIAIALPAERGGGLVVACIRDADRKALREISAESKVLAEKARTRGLGPEEMAETTFTISNLGMFGVEHFTAVINPPNSAILAAGAALAKPVVRDGQVVIGHEMTATLSSDHRIIDGAMAARFMHSLRELIENPATLLV